MDTECIILTKEGQLVVGIGSGDPIDFIRTSNSEFPGKKGFKIGALPESVTKKRISLYVEDENIFNMIKQNWE